VADDGTSTLAADFEDTGVTTTDAAGGGGPGSRFVAGTFGNADAPNTGVLTWGVDISGSAYSDLDTISVNAFTADGRPDQSDTFVLEYSTDGGTTWDEIDSVTGYAGGRSTVVLQGAIDGTVADFRLSFTAGNGKNFWHGFGDESATGADVTISAVPEPTTMGILGLGIIGLIKRRR
jgi:hypothetical protein